jgi:hypothetical protein
MQQYWDWIAAHVIKPYGLTRFIDKIFQAALDDGAIGVSIPHLGLMDDDEATKTAGEQ